MRSNLNNEVAVAFVALLGVAFGGITKALCDLFIARKKTIATQADEFREDLLQRISHLETRITDLEHQLDDYKSKYFTLLGDYTKVKAENDLLLSRYQQLQREVLDLQKRMGCLDES